ncbi:MAG TPA: hypothetical protein VN820_02840 [Acidimicrobiales bacterium]|nr:hypothetical protein [Acidimicrobiales bacterium]
MVVVDGGWVVGVVVVGGDAVVGVVVGAGAGACVTGVCAGAGGLVTGGGAWVVVEPAAAVVGVVGVAPAPAPAVPLAVPAGMPRFNTANHACAMPCPLA